MINCLFFDKAIMKPRASFFKRWEILIFLLVLLGIGCKALSTSELPLLTATPSATATPQPTMTPIPGWRKFEGAGIEIWLPESYLGGNISENLDLISEQVKALGPEYESYIQPVLQDPSIFSLWAYDSDMGSSLYLTSVGVTTDKLSYPVPLDTYVDESVSQFPGGMHLLGRDQVTLNGRDARRVVMEMKLPSVTTKALMYILIDGETVWIITFATASDEYETRLPVFEQSADTFNIVP